MGRQYSAGSRRHGFSGAFLRSALVVILLGSTGLSGGFFTPAQAQSYSFSSVTIEGNLRVDAATILGFAGIKRGQGVSAGELNDAYQRIINSGLFETVTIDPQGSTLVIRVAEYPTINVVDYQGNKRIDDEQLASITTSKSRLIYSPAKAEADAASIAEQYRVAGRGAATIEPRIIRRSDNRVDLVFEIQEGRTVEIERLSFVGNRAFSDRRLRQVLETKQAGFLRQLIKGDTFQSERLEVDKQMLRDFYLSRGFVDFEVLDASAELARERDATFVAFTVREGRSFNVGAVSTVSEVEGVDAAEFDAVRKLRSGVTYTPAVIENNVARMETLALRKGLNFIIVEPRIIRNDRDQVIDVQFVLTRGQKIFVERIDIEGNTTTLDQVVRRQFRSVEGDPFNPREVRQAAERIRALGYFENADVNAQQGSAPDQVVVNVDVEEKPTGALSFGASYGVSSGVGLAVSFSENNFLGRGQTLNLNIQSGTESSDSSISFVEPNFLGRDLRFRLSAGYRNTQTDNADYDTSEVFFGPSIDFPIGANSRLELRYRISEDKIDNVAGTDTDDPLDGSSLLLVAESDRGSVLTSAVGYTYVYDTRFTGLNPNARILFRFGQDFAGLGGDATYIESNLFALAETKVLKEEVAIRAIFEAGLINGIDGYGTRVTERYFGRSKIRGFEPNGIGPRDLGAANEDALGGNAFAVARFEADFPLGLPEEYGIKGGVFLDVGSVWSLDATNATVEGEDFSLRSAVGLSLFWDTPIGPLRFNFTRALKKETFDQEQNFDLTISTQF